MSYLSRLKQIKGGENFTHSPESELTKPPKAPFVSSVSTGRGPIENIAALKVGAGDTAAVKSWGWLIHYVDREPAESYFCPVVTLAELMALRPDAVAAEPFTPIIRQPSAPMTAEEETAIRAWLALIEETDPATIAEVIGQCQRDADARGYFIGRAAAELIQKGGE